jgi:hypothetical protein
MSTGTDHNKVRAAFMRRASAPHVHPYAFKLAYMIGFKYMNRETRVAFVGQETLARDLNVSTRTIKRLLDILKPLGLTIAPGHGPNSANSYWIDPEKGTPVSSIHAEKGTPVSSIEPGKGDSRRQKRGQPVQEKGTPVSPLLNKDSKRGTKEEKKDSRADVASHDSTTGDASRKPTRADLDAAFDRFWASYPKRVARQAAHRAFTKAIENGAAADALIAGAGRYAVERAGQDPKFTKHPATWLNAGCWEDEPTGARGPPIIDQDGHVVAYESPQQEQRPKGFESIGAALIANHKKNEWGW